MLYISILNEVVLYNNLTAEIAIETHLWKCEKKCIHHFAVEPPVNWHLNSLKPSSNYCVNTFYFCKSIFIIVSLSQFSPDSAV